MAKTKKIKIKKNISVKQKEPESVWGKNKPLEKFWQKLSNGKIVVLIYKDGKNKIVKLEKATEKIKKQYVEWDENSEIIAILSSPMSTDAYTVSLYPKAKKASVKEVIKNYKKYFKGDGTTSKNLAAQGWKWDKLFSPY